MYESFLHIYLHESFLHSYDSYLPRSPSFMREEFVRIAIGDFDSQYLQCLSNHSLPEYIFITIVSVGGVKSVIHLPSKSSDLLHYLLLSIASRCVEFVKTDFFRLKSALLTEVSRNEWDFSFRPPRRVQDSLAPTHGTRWSSGRCQPPSPHNISFGSIDSSHSSLIIKMMNGRSVIASGGKPRHPSKLAVSAILRNLLRHCEGQQISGKRNP